MLRDHRPSDPLRALGLVAGGVRSGFGALLIAASPRVLVRRFAVSRLGVVGLGVMRRPVPLSRDVRPCRPGRLLP